MLEGGLKQKLRRNGCMAAGTTCTGNQIYDLLACYAQVATIHINIGKEIPMKRAQCFVSLLVCLVAALSKETVLLHKTSSYLPHLL
jgi:hypothetical protein